MEELINKLSLLRRKLDTQRGQKDLILTNINELHVEVNQLREKISDHVQAASVLSALAESRQTDIYQTIEDIVTQGLRTIFSEDLSFHINAGTRGKVNTADFIIRSTLGSGNVVETSVMDARGGGLASVVGFLLRVVILLLSKTPGTIIFLDETFGMVSAGYESRLAEFLRELVDKTKIQIVLVTHSSGFSEVADKKYLFTLHEGLTKVTEE